jgi:proteic killer suppression protein
MVVTFEEDYLSELYEFGKTSDKKHRFQPAVVKLYIKRIRQLQSFERVEDLFSVNALNYEVLDGDKKGISSIRINTKYRIEFTVNVDNTVVPVVTVCNILELSNHYQ